MNNNITRREALTGIGIGCIAATAGCMGDDSDGGLGTNTIQSVHNDRGEIVIEVIDDHDITGVALYEPSGERGGFSPVSPTATQTTIRYRSSQLTNDTYEVVAYDDNQEPEETYEWTPAPDIEITGVEAPEDEHLAGTTADSSLRIDFINEGDLEDEINEMYVSGGFPTEHHDQDQVGESDALTRYTIGPHSETSASISSSEEGGLFENSDQSCDGETEIIEITVEMEVSGNVTKELEATSNGEYIDRGTSRNGCSDVEVELID